MDGVIRQMRTITLAYAMTYLLLSGGGLGVAAAAPQEKLTLKRLALDTKTRKDEGLQLTVDEVRSAFMERDTAKFARCLGSRKVYLSLKSRMKESGYYTRSQLQFIFDKMFQDLTTRSFEYSPRDIKGPDEGRAFLRSEWTFVALGSDTVVTENLRFTFEKEKEGWRISEIKSSSR
jgi:hypothetical protein